MDHLTTPVDMCPKCGSVLKSYVVQKENANKGRPFRTCPLDFCGHFEWADGVKKSLEEKKRPRPDFSDVRRQRVTMDDLDDDLRELMRFVIAQKEMLEDA